MSLENAVAIGGARWPDLTDLELRARTAPETAPFLDALQPLIDGSAAWRLRRFSILSLYAGTDKLIDRLIRSPFAARPEHLGVNDGSMSSAGAWTLAGAVSAFQPLKTIDIGGNDLNEETFALVKRAFGTRVVPDVQSRHVGDCG